MWFAINPSAGHKQVTRKAPISPQPAAHCLRKSFIRSNYFNLPSMLSTFKIKCMVSPAVSSTSASKLRPFLIFTGLFLVRVALGRVLHRDLTWYSPFNFTLSTKNTTRSSCETLRSACPAFHLPASRHTLSPDEFKQDKKMSIHMISMETQYKINFIFYTIIKTIIYIYNSKHFWNVYGMFMECLCIRNFK